MNEDQRRYPIGVFVRQSTYTDADHLANLEVLTAAPARLREVVQALSKVHLDTPYRPGGWTARQVIHHLPNSHLNA